MAQKDQYNVGSENADVYYHESLKLWRQKVFQLLILNENLNIQLKNSDQKFSNLQKELQISKEENLKIENKCQDEIKELKKRHVAELKQFKRSKIISLSLSLLCITLLFYI